MTIEDVILHYGSIYQLQLKTGICSTNLKYWRKVGYIPLPMQHRIQRKTRGKLRANEDHARRVK